jgi:hypothetical protein
MKTGVFCILIGVLAVTLCAQSYTPFIPSMGLATVSSQAQVDSGDSSVVLVSIQWTKYRSDGIDPGTFDYNGNGAVPVWDYTFLSPANNMLYEYTLVSSGAQFQIVHRSQRAQDTARPINRTWYDIDSLLDYFRSTLSRKYDEWKSNCPALELALVRLVQVRESYVHRTTIPMWMFDFWCTPSALKNRILIDTYKRLVAVIIDSLPLASVATPERPVMPSPDRVALSGNVLPLREPMPSDGTVRIVDLCGRVAWQQSLQAGSDIITIPDYLPSGTYSVLVFDAIGTLYRSFYVVRIE